MKSSKSHKNVAVLGKKSKIKSVGTDAKGVPTEVKLVKNSDLIYKSNRVSAYVHLVP